MTQIIYVNYFFVSYLILSAAGSEYFDNLEVLDEHESTIQQFL